MTTRLILFWVLGGLFSLAAAWIVSNLELTLGVTHVSYVLALLAALALYLLGGLCWISVAVAAKRH